MLYAPQHEPWPTTGIWYVAPSCMRSGTVGMLYTPAAAAAAKAKGRKRTADKTERTDREERGWDAKRGRIYGFRGGKPRERNIAQRKTKASIGNEIRTLIEMRKVSVKRNSGLT